MKETYQEWNPRRPALQLLLQINEILKDFERQGYQLTLRQLYYQLVSKDFIPNTIREYFRIGNVVNRGRLAGLIDWSMIEDRTRVPVSRAHWSSPKEIVESAAHSYYRSRWKDQENYIEVWCEKGAISNIIQPVCRRWDVTFMANRGYSSQSAMYVASQRLYLASRVSHKSVKVIYLGDHDPSGIDMTRDIKDRLGVFLSRGQFNDVDRIALNMDQIEKYRPPENPAKVTDSRFEGYVKIYGYSSWELDALEPKILEELVDNKIRKFVDFDLWREVERKETRHRDELLEIANGLEAEE